jgi:hypothetical protein
VSQVKQRDSEIAIMIGMVKGKSSSIAQASPTAASTGTAAAVAGGAPVDSSTAAAAGSSSDSGKVLSALLDARLLADRHAAFQVFRKSYRQGEVSCSLLKQQAVVSTVCAVFYGGALRHVLQYYCCDM